MAAISWGHAIANHTVRNETALALYTKMWGEATYAENYQDQWQKSPSHVEQYDHAEAHHEHDILMSLWDYSTIIAQLQLLVAQIAVCGFRQSFTGLRAEVEAARGVTGLYGGPSRLLESKQWDAPPLAVIGCKLP